MEHETTIHNGTSNGKYYYPGHNDALEYENSKKKTRKWSLSGLFKRRRNKSSDTDSSSELDDKKKGFLSKRTHRRKGCHKVVGKFETIIIPKEEPPQTNPIEVYDASPNVIKRKHNIELPNGVSQSNQEIATRHEPLECVKGSSGSLDTVSRRTEKSKFKARVQARRDRVRDESSSSEECASSRNSNCSLQRLQADYLKTGSGSWSRKSRAARTDRYIKRHYRDEDGSNCCSNSDLRLNQTSTPIGSPRSRWVAKVVYQQSSVSPTRYTARTHSATSSPMSSPLTKPKNFQCSLLPQKTNAIADQNKELIRLPDGAVNGHADSVNTVKMSPPPPPPRNPYRKVVPPVDKYVNRPSSYAFDASARPKDIAAFVSNNRSTGYGNPTNVINGAKLRMKSNSEMELRHTDKKTARQALGLNDHNSYPKNHKRYSTDKTARSRNPIQVTPKIRTDNELTPHINRNLFADEIKPKPFVQSNTSLNGHSESLREFGYTDAEQRSLSKANEIGIPVIEETVNYKHSNVTFAEEKRRPLSVLSEKSDNEILNGSATSPGAKPKPRNLEEALVELEEIYNSLKLSDEDLLDRADRRDLQASLKMNPKYNRHSWNDNNDNGDVDSVDGREHEHHVDRPRLSTSRRSAIPDAVTDDMAYRKLNKKDNQDIKSNPNIVSQSGSFLLMSPALSPPPLVDIPRPLIQFDKEPDITLDDVVFRNIRQANSTLRLLDPQPPFGIPLGPVSPAPNSDYLHAIPSEKYRSTFNPSRTPDVVKDDLAFRNLRKDVKSPDTTNQFLPASKKRRAIRSLSANVVSLIGRHYPENGDLIDVNNFKKNDRCASVNDLSEIDEEFAQKYDSNRDSDCNGDKALDLIADEAMVLSKVLRKTLRELEAIPTTNGFEKNVTNDKDVFTKRVAIHKPITLSQFKISEGVNEKNSRNPSSYAGDDDSKNNSDRSQLKLVRRQENITNGDVSKRGNVDGRVHSSTRNDNESPTKCQNFNWNSVKIVCPQYQPKRATLGEIKVELNEYESTDLKSDKTENSSSGVSSTSNTPDSSRKCQIGDAFRQFPSESNSPSDNIRAKELYLDENVLPSFEDASEQFSKELEGTDTVDKAETPKKDFCSRIEITLSTPQPAGTLRSLSAVRHLFSNDVLIILIYCIACLYEFLFAGCTLCELLLVLISTLAYFTISRP